MLNLQCLQLLAALTCFPSTSFTVTSFYAGYVVSCCYDLSSKNGTAGSTNSRLSSCIVSISLHFSFSSQWPQILLYRGGGSGCSTLPWCVIVSLLCWHGMAAWRCDPSLESFLIISCPCKISEIGLMRLLAQIWCNYCNVCFQNYAPIWCSCRMNRLTWKTLYQAHKEKYVMYTSL